jgi:hypothetical protein
MHKLELDAVLHSAHFKLIEGLLDTSDGSEAGMSRTMLKIGRVALLD